MSKTNNASSVSHCSKGHIPKNYVSFNFRDFYSKIDEEKERRGKKYIPLFFY